VARDPRHDAAHPLTPGLVQLLDHLPDRDDQRPDDDEGTGEEAHVGALPEPRPLRPPARLITIRLVAASPVDRLLMLTPP
jgi:hypothetical protein